MESSVEQAAVLVIRIWFEAGSLRGRVSSTLDVARHSDETKAVSSPAEVIAAVRDWLEAFGAGDVPG
jgi:hypothetical protein